MFLLGSFTSGLFGGAQSTLSLYQGIQGIMAQSDAAAQSKAIADQKTLDAANARGYTQADTAIGELQASRGETPTPPGEHPPDVAPTMPKPVTPVMAGGYGPAISGDAAERTAQSMRDASQAREADTQGRGYTVPGTPSTAGISGPSPMTTATGGLDDYGRPLPGYQLPPGATGTASGNPNAAAAGAPATAGAPAVPSANAPIQMPVQGGIPTGGLPGWAARPMPSYPQDQPLPPRGGGVGPTQAEQQTGIGTLFGPHPYPPANAPATPQPTPLPQTMPTVPAPSPTARAQTGLGTIFPGANPPPGSPPMTGQEMYGGTPPGYVAPAPPAGPRAGPQPQASLTDSILSALNPISSAQAAEGTTPQPAAPAPAPAPAPGTAGAAPTGSTKVSGVTGGTQPGPVPSTEKVVPGQTTPTTGSETKPAVAMSPPVSPRYGDMLRRDHPDIAARVDYWIQQRGGTPGTVMFDQVAAHMYRESKFNVNVGLGPDKEEGVMQILPSTKRSLEGLLGHPLDTRTLDGSLEAGVTLLRFLAMDRHLGPNSIQTNFAYMRGEGAVNAIAQPGGFDRVMNDKSAQGQSWRNALGWTENMYDGKYKMAQGQFTGGAGSPNFNHYTVPDAMVARQQGPDGVLRYVATTGPVGMGMSDRWAQFQSALERAAIWSGHLDALPHIADFVFQQSHQGALSNLAAADAALATGNSQLAVQYLAKAHAFFPDGTMGEFGIDNKGQVWGRQIGEGSLIPLGNPIQVTPDMLRQQMIAMANPANYAEVLQKYKLQNAQIERERAYAEYLRARPGIEEDKQAAIDARNQDRLEFKAREDQLKWEHQQDTKTIRGENTTAVDKSIESQYAEKPADVTRSDWAKQSEVDRRLRMPEAIGGSGLGYQTATEVAEGLTRNPKWSIERFRDDKGNEGYHILDDQGRERARLGPEKGRYIENMPGISGRTPYKGPATNPAANSNQRSALPIGAGIGSQIAAMQGYNQNLAGVPMRPQAPPQQQAIG